MGFGVINPNFLISFIFDCGIYAFGFVVYYTVNRGYFKKGGIKNEEYSKIC
jgi:hypothetical protein